MNIEQKEAAELAEKILEALEKQRFADWYNTGGRFDSYITCEYPEESPEHVTRAAVLNDIKRLFSL